MRTHRAVLRPRHVRALSVPQPPFPKKFPQRENMPGSGAHGEQDVPDRLRGAFAYYASDATRFNTDDVQYVSKGQRQGMMRQIMNSHSNMHSVATLDRVRTALDAAARREPQSEEWATAHTLLRTTEMCVELVREPEDVMPEGDRLWIDLKECQVQRRPYVWRIDKDTVVLPVFSFEEYSGLYFQRHGVFDATWFPVPRMGKQFEVFKQMDFPVMAHGSLPKLASLATVAAGDTFLVCLNPTLPTTKFLTYPELIAIASSKASGATSAPHCPALNRVFNTRSWPVGERVDSRALRETPAPVPALVPRVARDELALLLFDVPEVEAVVVAREAAGIMQRLRSAESLVVRVVTRDVPPPLLTERLHHWSFLQESDLPTVVEYVSSLPPSGDKIYEAASPQADRLRQTAVAVGRTLREELDYDAAL